MLQCFGYLGHSYGLSPVSLNIGGWLRFWKSCLVFIPAMAIWVVLVLGVIRILCLRYFSGFSLRFLVGSSFLVFWALSWELLISAYLVLKQFKSLSLITMLYSSPCLSIANYLSCQGSLRNHLEASFSKRYSTHWLLK